MSSKPHSDLHPRPLYMRLLAMLVVMQAIYVNNIYTLRELGYDVFPVALDGDDSGQRIFYIRGFGMGAYVGEKDDETWRGLIDTHEQRMEVQGASSAK